MSFVTGVTLKVLVNQYEMSGYFNSLGINCERSMYDTTVFGNTSKNVIPGFKGGSIDIGGFYEEVATASAPENVFTAIEASATVPIVSIFPEGWALGSRAYLLQAHKNNHKLSAVVDDLVKMDATFTDNDGYDFGVSLHGLTAETSLPFTGTAVDNLALTSNGGVAFLHVSAIAGASPNVVIKVQHAAVSTYADLVTFTATTAASSQRVVVAAATTVNRNLRVTMTEGGTTSSITASVSFARR
jgi:hypothetical protein